MAAASVPYHHPAQKWASIIVQYSGYTWASNPDRKMAMLAPRYHTIIIAFLGAILMAM
jgi:hypothetical protein